MSILVTGANGLVGNHLLAALQSEADVIGLSRTPPPAAGGARWITADLADPEFVDALPGGVRTVVHLAQSARYADFPAGARDVFNVNVGSTARLLEWAHRAGIERFVFASAGGVDKSVSAHRPSFYLAGKLAAELMARSYAEWMTVTVLRLFFVYGPGQRRTMLIPRLVDTVRDGRSITLAGQDGIRITPTHVDDAVAAFCSAALNDRPGLFDVAGPETLSLRRIGEIIGHRLGVVPRFDIVDRPAADLVGDTAAMTAQLAAPRRLLRDGLEDAI